MITKKIKKNNGFVLLFAVMLSSIILAIALGVMSIALKEINFSTSAKDTNEAFYAADVGVECALLNDKSTAISFTSFNNEGFLEFPCFGVNPSLGGDSTVSPWNFVLAGLGSSGNACAIVSVTKITDSNGVLITTINSKGYNKGGNSPESCTPSSNSIERELQVTY